MASPADPSVRCRLHVLRSREAFVRQYYGGEGMRRLIEAASPALRPLLDDPTRSDREWVTFDSMVECTVLIDQLFGAGDLALARELGYHSSTTAAGPWKTWALRHTPVSVALQLAAGVWRYYYSHGRMALRPDGAGVMGAIEDFPVFHRAHCLVVVGWLYGVLSMGPRRNVVVEERSCRALGDATCTLRSSWEDG